MRESNKHSRLEYADLASAEILLAKRGNVAHWIPRLSRADRLTDAPYMEIRWDGRSAEAEVPSFLR